MTTATPTHQIEQITAWMNSEIGALGRMSVSAQYAICRVPVDMLTVDIRVQQPLREGKVREMLARGYDEGAAGTIEVSRRADGKLVVIDGQHRTETAKRAGATHIVAKVWSGLTLAQEGHLFTYLNKKSNPTAVSTFKTRIVAGEDVPVNIAGIVEAQGWMITDNKNSKRAFSAVRTLEDIYRSKGAFKTIRPGSQVLSRTVAAVTGAWGTTNEASKGQIVAGVALFLIRYWDEADDKRLSAQLKKITPGQIEAEARAFRSSTGASPAIAHAYIVHREYNRNLRTKLDRFQI